MNSWLHGFVNWLNDSARHAAIQLDPLSAAVALVALAYSVQANLRTRRLEKRERDRAGKIDRVEIQQHSFQPGLAGMQGRRRVSSPAKEIGQDEFFRCSVHSGETETDIEGVALFCDYTEGWLGQRHVRVRVDLTNEEGHARHFPKVPQRMVPHSRLDWDLLPFLTFFPNRRGGERLLNGVVRLMSPREQLVLRFRAFSRSSPDPTTSTQTHRLSLMGFPFRSSRWSQLTTYESAWDLIMDDEAPPSLQAWMLPWVEKRSDFDVRLLQDETGKLEQKILQIKKDCYWPPGTRKDSDGIYSILAQAREQGIPGARLLNLERALKLVVAGAIHAHIYPVTDLDQAAVKIHSLVVARQRRTLKKGDLAEYRRAYNVLCSEVAAVMGVTEDNAKTFIDSVLLPQITED